MCIVLILISSYVSMYKKCEKIFASLTGEFWGYILHNVVFTIHGKVFVKIRNGNFLLSCLLTVCFVLFCFEEDIISRR